MTSVWRENSSGVRDELGRAGIADYQDSAAREVASFINDQQRTYPSQESGVFSLERELILLSAAEFALAPALTQPTEAAIPPNSPLQVTEDHARLAILKYDCPLSFPEHLRTEIVRPWDVMVFGGDISKTELVLPDWNRINEGPHIVFDLVGQLEAMHMASGSQLAQQVVESGAIRVQGLLWRMKLSLLIPASFGPGITEAIDEALDQLGLRRR